MGMYDRDWYREERRQQRQLEREARQLSPKPSVLTVRPARRSDGPSWLLISVLVVALALALGFA